MSARSFTVKLSLELLGSSGGLMDGYVSDPQPCTPDLACLVLEEAINANRGHETWMATEGIPSSSHSIGTRGLP